MFGVVCDIRHREKKSERFNGICEPVRSRQSRPHVLMELLNLGSPKYIELYLEELEIENTPIVPYCKKLSLAHYKFTDSMIM